MLSGDGSTNTPRRCIRFSARSTGGRRREVVKASLLPELADYARRYAEANKMSVSSLIEELVRWLRDEA